MATDTGDEFDPGVEDGGLTGVHLLDSSDDNPDDNQPDDGDVEARPGRSRTGPVVVAVVILAVVVLAVWIGVGHLRSTRSHAQGPSDAPAFGNDPYFGTSAYVYVDNVQRCSDDIGPAGEVGRTYFDRNGRVVQGGVPRVARVLGLDLTPELLTAMAASPATLQARLAAAVGTTPAGIADPESRRLSVLEWVLSMPVLPQVRANALAVLRALPRTTVAADQRDRYGAIGTRLTLPTGSGGKFVLQYNPVTRLLQSADDAIALHGATITTCTRRIVDVGPADTTPA